MKVNESDKDIGPNKEQREMKVVRNVNNHERHKGVINNKNENI